MTTKKKYEEMKPIWSSVYSNPAFWQSKDLKKFTPFINRLLLQGYYQFSDMETKRKIIALILNLEVKNLALGHDIQLYFQDLSGKKCIGLYRSSENAIIIDSRYAINMTGTELLRVIAHEARHGYQYHLISDWHKNQNKYSTVKGKEIKRFEYELFGHYYDISMGRDKYREQKVEVDARKYEVLRLDKYHYVLDCKRKVAYEEN